MTDEHLTIYYQTPDGISRGATAPSHPDTSDLFLSSDEAAHESAGVLRFLRSGMSAPKISKELGLSKQQLVHELNLAIDDEAEAHRIGVPIIDSGIPKGTL